MKGLHEKFSNIFSQLSFNNTNKTLVSSALLREEARLPAIASHYLFFLFPFIISFGPDMIIGTIGKSLSQVFRTLLVKLLSVNINRKY